MKNIPKDELENLVKTSSSITEIFSKLKLNNIYSSTHYRTFRRLVEQYNIDCSHFKRGNKSTNTFVQKRPLEVYLNNEYPIQSNKLKNRLLSEKVFEHKCDTCKLTEWNELPIPLQLDHIDGNSDNNNLSNLRLLCPNCHALTDTYCGKNIKKGIKNTKPHPIKVKPKPEKIITEKPKKCQLTNEEIYQVFVDNDKNYSKTGKILGISDNAVRKRIKNIN
jgi:hypothetical protein